MLTHILHRPSIDQITNLPKNKKPPLMYVGCRMLGSEDSVEFHEWELGQISQSVACIEVEN